jgi:hypothetical protein
VKYLNQNQIKIRMLTYTFGVGKAGVNAYTVLHKAKIPWQGLKRGRRFLEELCKAKLLDKIPQETSGDKIRFNYAITEKGRETVLDYRDSPIQELFGRIDDLFEESDKY